MRVRYTLNYFLICPIWQLIVVEYLLYVRQSLLIDQIFLDHERVWRSLILSTIGFYLYHLLSAIAFFLLVLGWAIRSRVIRTNKGTTIL